MPPITAQSPAAAIAEAEKAGVPFVGVGQPDFDVDVRALRGRTGKPRGLRRGGDSATRSGPVVARYLDAYDILVRRNEAIPILEKVKAKKEPTLDARVSSQKPFGLRTFFHGKPDPKRLSTGDAGWRRL